MWYPILVMVLVGYLLGNLNGSVCMSVLQGREDVRSRGSGNAGLTNFVRNFGFSSAIVVILIDVGKTVLACLAGELMLKSYGYAREGMVLGAVAVSLGHDFPALMGFRGGKGILCGIAAAAVLDWRAALIILGVFIVFYLVSGYVSLGSVMGAVTYCVCFIVFHFEEPWVMAGGVFLGLLALFMHRGNIARLCKGTEKKTSLFRKEKQS